MLDFILSFMLLGLLVYVVIPVLLIVLQYTIGPKIFGKRKQLPKAGQWAIITGASDGIGKAFAEELASDGLDLLLISRTAAKLDALSSELRTKYNVSVKYLALDFTHEEDIYHQVRMEIQSLPSIACLVNNVSMVNVNPEEFNFDKGMCIDRIQDFIRCNCLSVAAMTHVVLPRLVAQNSGASVINIASFSSITPLPYISLYGATKAFTRHFSQSIAPELVGSNVLIQTVYPMYVSTAMVGRRRGFFVISPAQCARGCLDMLGVKSYLAGHLLHELQIFYFSFLPHSIFVDSMEKKLQRARKRMLKTQ